MTTDIPRWLAELNEEDLHFLQRFLLVSGSLKALAEHYGVSYPTVRARLDRLIAKVKVADDNSVTDPFRRQLQLFLADGILGVEVARQLLDAYRQAMDEGESKGRSDEQKD
ncbi:MAG: DUF2089 family protein [Armatimonadota bacterium]|nr:MAG: DUF2089 family protein [Armatimonadota bacterium]